MKTYRITYGTQRKVGSILVEASNMYEAIGYVYCRLNCDKRKLFSNSSRMVRITGVELVENV